MERKKIIKKIYLVFICLSADALIVFNFYQHQKIIRLSHGENPQVSAMNESKVTKPPENKDAAQSSALPEEKKGTSNNDFDDLKYQVGAAQEELDMVNKQLSDETARKAELRKNEIESFKKGLKDPSYKNNLRKTLDSSFADLFKDMNLSPEKLEKVKDLLVDQQMIFGELMMEMETITPSEAEKKRDKIRQRVEEYNKENERKISEFLGKNDYEKYKQYTESWGERRSVTGFIKSLGSDGNLTGDQQQKLIDAMFESRKSVEYENREDGFRFPSEMYDEEYIARRMNYESRKDEAYIRAAQNILTSSHTEQFKAYLKKQHDEFESYEKTQALKYGTLTAQKGSDKK
jgi:hypothetical protein